MEALMEQKKNSPYKMSLELLGESHSAWAAKMDKMNEVGENQPNTMKLYLVNVFEAYRADEQGIKAFRELPNDTIYYKHEVLEEADATLPAGFEVCATQGEGTEIFKGDEAAEMITEHVGTSYVTSLVTSDGIVELYKWNYGK